MASTSSTPVWVDTDCGVDDALALAVLAAHGVPLLGVSSVHGNVDASGAAANAAGVLRRLGVDVHVRVGRTGPDPRAPGSRHGPDGLGGSGWGRHDLVADGDAAESLAAASSHPLRLLSIGPATTLAAAADLDPTAAASWRPVVVVAGAGGLSLDTNTTADHAAMRRLLRTGAEIVVVSPEARWGAAVADAALQRLQREAPTWWSLATGYVDAQSAAAGRPLLVAHDALAAAVLLDPEVVSSSHRVGVRATRGGVGPAGGADADAEVTWVEALRPGAADVVVDALAAAERLLAEAATGR